MGTTLKFSYLMEMKKVNAGSANALESFPHTANKTVAQPKIIHKVVAQPTQAHELSQKPTITHEEEKIALVLFLAGGFVIWNIFQ